MSDVATAQLLMREAFPTGRGRNVKSCIGDAYVKLKLRTERRAKSIWYGEAKSIPNYEMDALEDAIIKRARHEFERTKDRLSQIETTLGVHDKNVRRPTFNALRQLFSGIDRPLD